MIRAAQEFDRLAHELLWSLHAPPETEPGAESLDQN